LFFCFVHTLTKLLLGFGGVFEGGFLLDGGVHSSALLRTALDSHPVSLAGHVSLNLKHLAPTDSFTVIAQSSDGSHGLFELSEGAPNPSRNTKWFKITGQEGWIDVRPAPGGVVKITLHKSKKQDEDVQVLEIKSEGVKKEIEYWVNAVHGEKTENVGDPREALRDVAFIEAGLKSKGEKIDLEKLLKEGK